MATARRKSDRFDTSSRTSSSSMLHISIGSDLDAVLDDRKIRSNPQENKNRRTIVIIRFNGSYGFTLQSYGLKHPESDEVQHLSYVDYVELDGPASKAGMRTGDVILAINGESMEDADHERLISCIRNSQDVLRLVVLFEDVSRKIELHLRFVKLKEILAAKYNELRLLESQEMKILEKVGAFGGGSRNQSSSFLSEEPSSLGSEITLYGCFTEHKMSMPRKSLWSEEFLLTPNSLDGTMLSRDQPFGLITPTDSALPKRKPINSLTSPEHGTLNAGKPLGAFSYADNAFYESTPGYGSLPTRSKKKKVPTATLR